MSSRDRILARLKNNQFSGMQNPVLPLDRDIYLDYPAVTSSLTATFQERLTLLQGEVHLAASRQQVADYLYEVLKEFPPQSTLLQPGIPLLTGIVSTRTEFKSIVDDKFSLSSDSISFARYNCAITTADYLIARTGSVLLNSASAAGRRLSVLPPVHIVIAEEGQIVPSLQEAFQLLKGRSFDWSYAVLITGPSRTSDIEKQLVLGAHGPKRLVVIILRS